MTEALKLQDQGPEDDDINQDAPWSTWSVNCDSN
jgi:hypothetical protein